MGCLKSKIRFADRYLYQILPNLKNIISRYQLFTNQFVIRRKS